MAMPVDRPSRDKYTASDWKAFGYREAFHWTGTVWCDMIKKMPDPLRRHKAIVEYFHQPQMYANLGFIHPPKPSDEGEETTTRAPRPFISDIFERSMLEAPEDIADFMRKRAQQQFEKHPFIAKRFHELHKQNEPWTEDNMPTAKQLDWVAKGAEIWGLLGNEAAKRFRNEPRRWHGGAEDVDTFIVDNPGRIREAHIDIADLYVIGSGMDEGNVDGPLERLISFWENGLREAMVGQPLHTVVSKLPSNVRFAAIIGMTPFDTPDEMRESVERLTENLQMLFAPPVHDIGLEMD